MKISTNKRLAIGIALLSCLPVFAIGAGIVSYAAANWYFSTAIIELETVNFQNLNTAFQEVAQQSPDVSLEERRNTDLVEIQVRGRNAQQASDKANSIAAVLVQKLHVQGPDSLRILEPAQPAQYPMRASIPLNTMVGALLGVLPAIAGAIVVGLGLGQRFANYSEARQGV